MWGETCEYTKHFVFQDSLDSVEALIKKHQDFEKSLAPQGEKLNALEVFSQKLLAEGHYESEAVVTRKDSVLQRYVYYMTTRES